MPVEPGLLLVDTGSPALARLDEQGGLDTGSLAVARLGRVPLPLSNGSASQPVEGDGGFPR